jgi:hypothetical protein
MMQPRVLTETELDQQLGVKAKLASGGDYGCSCLVFDGDCELIEAVALCLSDRLMCLIVIGDFSATKLSIFETEMLVCGNLAVGELVDRDSYLKVIGKTTIDAGAVVK